MADDDEHNDDDNDDDETGVMVKEITRIDESLTWSPLRPSSTHYDH